MESRRIDVDGEEVVFFFGSSVMAPTGRLPVSPRKHLRARAPHRKRLAIDLGPARHGALEDYPAEDLLSLWRDAWVG